MVEATIPVELTNPGQVFACLGFMEAAEALGFEGVEGWFDWTSQYASTFTIGAEGEENPVEAVLEFLANADLAALAPAGDESIKLKVVPTLHEQGNTYFVGPPPTTTTAPVRLFRADEQLTLFHWADGSGRAPFKTFAGQQVAVEIFRKILKTEFGKPTKKEPAGKRKTQALDTLFNDDKAVWIEDPFGQCAALSSAFGFDARGAWDAMRIGSSLDAQDRPAGISAAVEVLAPVGLSNSRPHALSAYELLYSVWRDRQPLSLARPLLGMVESIPGYQLRRFKTHLGDDKYYKKFFFATEITR